MKIVASFEFHDSVKNHFINWPARIALIKLRIKDAVFIVEDEGFVPFIRTPETSSFGISKMYFWASGTEHA